MNLPVTQRFECKQCAKCCTNARGGSFGLSMFDFEAEDLKQKALEKNVTLSLEPSSFVVEHGTRIVIQWKMKNEQCPFLEKNECGIYSDRPLVCRSFPVASTGLHGKMPMMRSILCPEEKGLPSLGQKEAVHVAIPKLMYRYHKNFLACYLLEELVSQQEKDVSSLVHSPVETDASAEMPTIGLMEYLRSKELHSQEALDALKAEIREFTQTRNKLKWLLRNSIAESHQRE
jgi:Fe-S-cluster containining protein